MPFATLSQGRVSLDTGKVYLDQMDISEEDLQAVTSIKIAACGTSWHAGLAGKYMIEKLARVPVEVDYASEFRYRDPVLNETDLLIVISQSGETADTIAAMREAKQAGCKVLADLQRSGFDDPPRGGRDDPDARGAGDRRCVDQGLHVADGRAVSVCAHIWARFAAWLTVRRRRNSRRNWPNCR